MRTLFVGIVALFLAWPASAQKSLYWKAIDVQASLDAAGTIHVTERQTFVFDGDWNGGERIFRLEKGQSFALRGMSRVDESGQLIPMQEGSLDEVDHYAFTDPKTLRWRSRLPSDPPFQSAVITYVLDYSLENVVVKRPGDYLLDHDFLFPDRSGRVEKFTLDLTLDPAWDSGAGARHVEKETLPPGEGVLLTIPLKWRGQGSPSSVRADELPIRLALLAILLIVPVLLWNRLLNRERALGRLAPLTPHEINHEWIERNLLPIKAEVVGAAWDEAVGEDEVSALLARWTAEGKIETRVTSSDAEELKTKLASLQQSSENDAVKAPNGLASFIEKVLPASPGGLSMTLKVPRESFTGSERALIDALFYSGDHTSTDGIKSHYKQRGFSPSALVKADLDKEAEALTARLGEKIKISPLPSLILFGLTAWASYIGFKRLSDPPPSLFVFAVIMLLAATISAAVAATWRTRLDRTEKDAGFRVPVALAVLGAAAILMRDLFNLPLQLAFIMGALFIANSSMNTARSRRGPKAIAFRKKIVSAREYFLNELKKKDPALDDRWFPYIIAFGLNDQASKWMQSFGGVGQNVSHHRSSSSSFSSRSSEGSSSGWTGGGGAFGGAGASASWAAAASGIASGVSAPSSSSSSGGGSSSSGSSGGGGGGGW